MSALEKYLSSVPDWATSAEYVIHQPEGELDLEFTVPEQHTNYFLIVAISTPNDLIPPFLNAKFELYGPNGYYYEPGDNESYFFSPDKKLAVIMYPDSGQWRINSNSNGERIPYSVNIMVFHPEIPPNSPPSPGSSGSSPFKCNACKITTKALALSIVAAATLPVLPGALIASVTAYLGVGSIVAAAFISSVLGDTADIIAEKLCKKVKLC